jgi:hypothetical protein
MLKSIILVAFLVNFSSALYFHIGETERKCFIEEIPDETTVLGICHFPFSRLPDMVGILMKVIANTRFILQ